MSASMQAIIRSARAGAPWASNEPMAVRTGTGWIGPQLVVRPRARRQALALRQDA